MKKHTLVIALCAGLLCLMILGCATPFYQDRRRALIYSPPASFHPYSTALAKELGYKEQWKLPLAGTTNVDAASLQITRITDESFVASLKETPLAGERTTNFLVSGIHTASPRIVSRSFPGTILPVGGEIYCVEETSTGFSLSAYDENMSPTDVKKITCYKYKHAENNMLDSTSTGNFHEEGNISSYFYADPYIVFTSVNYSTDKYYASTHYQSQAVSANTVQFICVNLLTGDTFRTAEVNFGPYYKSQNNKALPGVLTPSSSAFFVIPDQVAFAFTLTDDQKDSYLCYFTPEAGKDAGIRVDTAENIVKMFPSLTLTNQVVMEETAEIRILRQAISTGGTITLAGEDRPVIAFQGIPGDGFLIYSREKARNGSPCSLFYTDLTLQTVRWKHDFAKGVTVSEGVVNTADGNVLLTDCDASGGGLLLVKMLQTGNESRLVPVNVVQKDLDADAAGYCFVGGGLALYDDQSGTVSYFIQQK